MQFSSGPQHAYHGSLVTSTDTPVYARGLHPSSPLSFCVGLCSLRAVSICSIHGPDGVEGFSHLCRLAPQSQFQGKILLNLIVHSCKSLSVRRHIPCAWILSSLQPSKNKALKSVFILSQLQLSWVHHLFGPQTYKIFKGWYFA